MCVLCVEVMCFWCLSDWFFFLFFFVFFSMKLSNSCFVCNDLVFIVYTFYLVMYCIDICLH